jgi:tetratricopeptide (TPR) repeat protein
MNDLLKQIDKQDVQYIDKDLGFKICDMEDIEKIVLGSFTKAGNVFATDVKVLNVNSKELVTSVSSRGDGVASILTSQIDELSERISLGMGVSSQKITETKRPIVEVTTSSMDAYNYFLRGREDWEKKYFTDAKKFLEKAVTLDSTFAIAYLYLGRTYNGLGYAQARNATFEKAKNYSEQLPERERFYIEGDYSFYVEKDRQNFMRIYHEIVKKYPQEKRAYLWLGYHYNRDNRYGLAIEMYKKALEIDPYFGYAHNLIGHTYSLLEEYDKALEYLQRFATIYPGDAEPLESIAEVFLRMGELEKAKEKYREAVEVRPDYYWAYMSIAYIEAISENYSEAIAEIDQMITVASTPGNKAVGSTLKGFYLFWLGRVEESIAELKRAEELSEKTGSDNWKSIVDWVRGWIYFDLGNYKLGQKHFKKWSTVQASTFHQQSQRFQAEYIIYDGYINIIRGEIESAKSKLIEIRSLLPSINPGDRKRLQIFSELFYSELLLAQDSIPKAIMICKNTSPLIILNVTPWRLIAHNALIPSPNVLLAKAYQQNGNLDKAITQYERYITFNPDDKERRLIYPKYHYKLAQLYEEKGFTDKAIEQYQKFLEIWRDADESLPDLLDAQLRFERLKQIQDE